ncbi:MAG TPA: adenylate/guanylate cyclase domain-containing protein [Acidimicrobiia bacterium]|nr:adenylate/guanylate cyclase domain-containing protein [Acidimicrobiia bacterium]
MTSTTRELLREKSAIVTHAIVDKVTAHLRSTEELAAHLAGLLAKHPDLRLSNEDLVGVLGASLSATPHISTAALVEPELRPLRVSRTPRRALQRIVDWSEVPSFANMIHTGRQRHRPGWGSLFFSEYSETTFLNYLHPIRGTSLTLLLSTSVVDLSTYLEEMQKVMGGNSFVLYDRHSVLAHPVLSGVFEGLSDRVPLPALDGFPDRVLRSIWSAERMPEIEPLFSNGLAARVIEVGGTPHVFLYRDLQGFGPVPLQVGTYFALDAGAPQIERARETLLVGSVLIALSLIMALVISQLISRPFRAFRRAADRISTLDFDCDIDIPNSRILEVRELSQAFHSMMTGLRSFERYVPEGLVPRVMRTVGTGDIEAEDREVSVLFTDIVGFTSMAEMMPAKAVVGLLNEHLELVDGCIEAEGGTIDKYIGDSVMAFWGGMHSDANHATHACRAALRIEDAIRRNNRDRVARGEPPLHVRIGIHTGPVMIGNIGSASRISYTVIGDTVNIASRLEEFAREVDGPEREALTVVSGETASRMGDEFGLRNVGDIALRGRFGTTEVFELRPDSTEDTAT